MDSWINAALQVSALQVNPLVSTLVLMDSWINAIRAGCGMSLAFMGFQPLF